mmetsp:Transcript_1114/g.1951  ORF Transcript_1114/g.1951 Transcript_1114/m.1951 type:complete len:347 (+) Transcript_1114:178-1218(+)|eukprot:CAMPEP_0183788306 /NCGR_PEP_ID=MMETSP0739-20130205/67996_1 /TAXON_ID=385413 /ORGANISM="Thalassiosira miniscula, Strain CCMP1093" /LENGTH=346 /DNA_ID=CAMNT_0026032425 /DNA_START=131 /DNA_END=1171 /DNA_ORIENTATION=-
MSLDGGQISSIVNSIALLCLLVVLMRDYISQPAPAAPANPGTTHMNLVTAGNDDIESKQNDRCLSIDSGLPELIDATNQVLIMTPPKAAGSSVKQFARDCTRGDFKKYVLQYPDMIEDLLTHSYETPKVLASHILEPNHLIHLVKTTTRDTLTIYVHRPETSRLHSAIKYVLSIRGCRCVASNECMGSRRQSPVTFEKVDGFDCYVKEDHVLELTKLKINEIGGTVEKLLTCKTYDALDEYAPTMVFMDYRKITEVSDVLAGKYCPELVGNESQLNLAEEKEHRVFVMTNATHSVPVEEWLETKSSLLELALGLNHKASCMAKTRKWEDMLNSCEDGFLNVKGLDF